MQYDSTQFIVSLTDAKTYLGVTNTNEDDMLSMMLQAIRSQFDEYTQKTLLSGEKTEIKSGRGGEYIPVNDWPIDDSAGMSAYFDPNGIFGSGTLIDSQYLSVDYGSGLIRYIGGAFWVGHMNTKIVYTGPKGYTAGNMPGAIQLACMEMLGLIFQRRQDKQWTYMMKSRMEGTISLVTGEMPKIVKDLLDPFRNADHDHI